MIDDIRFKITDQTAKLWRLNIEPDHQTGNEHFQGHIKNMAIRETLDGVTIYGSIAKYYKGENITPLTRQEYEEALHGLELETGLDLNKAILQRVEIGDSIILKNPVIQYLQCFDNKGRFKRLQVDDTAGLNTVSYYTNAGARAFCVYDKIQEMQDRRERVPGLYEGCNVLRLEYKIVKRQGIKHYLGNGQDITPYDLADKELYKKLAGQYKDFYGTIPKTNRQVFVDGGQEVTPKELNDVIAEYYRQTSPAQYRALFQDLKTRGLISSKSIERIKAQERRNAMNYGISDTNAHIAELNDKVLI